MEAALQPAKTHLGSFDAETLRRRARALDVEPTPLRDAVSLMAMLGFCLAVSFVLVFTVLPEIPA